MPRKSATDRRTGAEPDSQRVPSSDRVMYALFGLSG
jgi:hypothetical protein